MKKQLLLLLSCVFLFACSTDTKQINAFPENKKVLVLGLDGVRSDAFREDLAPFMHLMKLDENVVYNLEHRIEDLTFSGPNWATICTGVHYEKHQVLDNLFSNNDLKNHPHFFQYLNDYFGEDNVSLASIAHWFPINYFMTIHKADYGPVEFNYSDERVYVECIDLIQNRKPIDPDVLFVHFDQLDAAGHSSGFHPDSSVYGASVTTINNYVKNLLAAKDQRSIEFNEDWLTIIVSDHGGDGTVHGGGAGNPAIDRTILFVHNKAIDGNRRLDFSEQVDIVPTILDFLDVDYSNLDLDGKSLLQ